MGWLICSCRTNSSHFRTVLWGNWKGFWGELRRLATWALEMHFSSWMWICCNIYAAGWDFLQIKTLRAAMRTQVYMHSKPDMILESTIGCKTSAQLSLCIRWHWWDCWPRVNCFIKSFMNREANQKPHPHPFPNRPKPDCDDNGVRLLRTIEEVPNSLRSAGKRIPKLQRAFSIHSCCCYSLSPD